MDRALTLGRRQIAESLLSRCPAARQWTYVQNTLSVVLAHARSWYQAGFNRALAIAAARRRGCAVRRPGFFARSAAGAILR